MISDPYLRGRREFLWLTTKAILFGLTLGGVVLYLLAPERTHRSWR